MCNQTFTLSKILVLHKCFARSKHNKLYLANWTLEYLFLMFEKFSYTMTSVEIENSTMYNQVNRSLHSRDYRTRRFRALTDIRIY